MIEAFTKAWFANINSMREKFTTEHPDDYKEVVRAVIEMLSNVDANGCNVKPDPERIHEIDDGDYQGTLVYVIGTQGYQPSEYFYVRMSYGSCSGCDLLASIRGHLSAPPDEDQVSQYMTLALHVVQKLRLMDGEPT